MKIKDELTKDRDEKLTEVTRQREELANATTKQQKAEQDREEAEMKIAEVEESLMMITLIVIMNLLRKVKIAG